MCDCLALQLGADAAADLLADTLRVPVAKSPNPLNHTAFVVIVRRVARALRAEASPSEQAVVKKLSQIYDRDWPRMTAAQRKAALAEAKSLMGATAAKQLPGIQATLKTEGTAIVGDTRKRVVQKYDFTIQSSMTTRDKATAAHLVETNALFVRNNYGDVAERLSEKARIIVASGIERGLGRDDIAADLIVAAKAARRPDYYWNMIATVFANRARNFTQIHAFGEAGIRAYTLLAVLDEVTTDFCRFIDGKEFPTDKAEDRIRRVQEAPDPEDILDLMPWARVGRDKDGNQYLYYRPDRTSDERKIICRIKESGVGERDKIGTYTQMMMPEALAAAGFTTPPYHGNCRTTVMPVF